MVKRRIVAVFSRGIYKKKVLKSLLAVDDFLLNPADNTNCEFVVGWGKKRNTDTAKAYAKQWGLNYFALEDGFIHSTGQGVLGASSCSLVKDQTGIYYDATQPSDLETIILDDKNKHLNTKTIERAQNAIKQIIRGNITKYNNGTLQVKLATKHDQKVVLLIDQTAGDMSLKYGYVHSNTFNNMLQAALNENPDALIIIKTHPDVIAEKKKGCIDLNRLDKRVIILSEPVNPLVLLKEVDLVYVGTSQMGFEALMLGKPVVCFGVPFYAGWGLTDDRGKKELTVWSRRNKKRTLEEVFAAAYIHYTRYIHPDTQKRCELEDILDYFQMQHAKALKVKGQLYCINFTRWKQNYIKSFLKTGLPLVFISSAKQAIHKGFNDSSQLVTWASKDQTEVNKLIKEFSITPWYVEDGFIRSAGLGTDLTAPASLVVDKSGIYYDPSISSDLEKILQNKIFSESELLRARALIKSLLENEISKYNLGSRINRTLFDARSDQKLILIPGQVEDDASIKKGCIDVNTNGDLIKAVKEKMPDAYLIYKPHPDVVSGNRRGKVDKKTLECCDYVLMDASITDCLELVDEVHTMTSLVGFEGLLRQLKVVCYGQPFYSGWSLTDDRHPLDRRTRKLTLDALVVATLIEYPLYINWKTKAFTTPEVIIEQLNQTIRNQGGKQSNQVFWLKRQARKLKNIVRGVFNQ